MRRVSGGRCECPPGMFELEGSCESCPLGCVTCEAMVGCMACFEGAVVHPETQICECQAPGTYPDAKTEKCLSCGLHCMKCAGPSTCQICSSTFTLNPNTGQCSCTNSTSHNTTIAQCQSCGAFCSICSDLTSCKICQPPYFLNSNGSCTLTCLNTPTTRCLNCPATCTQCRAPYACISCESGLYLIGSTCRSSCPDGTYSSNEGLCRKCSSVCLSCVGSETNCASCPKPYYLFNGGCVQGGMRRLVGLDLV